MKISELITKLQELKEVHGDLIVAIHNREYNCLETVMPVYKDGRAFKVNGAPIRPTIIL